MLGETLTIEEYSFTVAESISKLVLAERNKNPKFYKYIVGITGEYESGKAEISNALAKRLKTEHIRVKIIHAENYYKVAPLLRLEWRRTKGLDSVGMDEYDWNLLNRNIQDFKEERESMMPYTDLIPEQVDKLITDFKKIDLLIIEGLYAIKTDGIDLRIFIDFNGKSDHQKEGYSDFQLQVVEKENKNVHALKALADVIISQNHIVMNARTGEII
jgi:uridine kinase